MRGDIYYSVYNSRTFCAVILGPATQGFPKWMLGLTAILSFIISTLYISVNLSFPQVAERRLSLTCLFFWPEFTNLKILTLDT